MKAKVLIGVSASGKSTMARELCKKGYLALDRDDLRFSLRKAENWGEYRFDRAVEKMITDAHWTMIKAAAVKGMDIVIAETNLNPSGRAKWLRSLQELGYQVEFVPLHIELDEAIHRDAARQYSVGESVIRDKQWPNWLLYLQEISDATAKQYSLLPLTALEKLPTPRLLTYYKKYRTTGASYFRGEKNPLDNYFDDVRALLATREHVGG